MAKKNGVDLQGICIYPVTDRPDWDDLSNYCQCGIWDLDENFNRIPYQEYIDALVKAQISFKKKKYKIHHFMDLFR
ncbi:hypothetical protein D3C87_2055550 [compost metagenome]